MLDGTSKVLAINDSESINTDAGVTSIDISPNGQPGHITPAWAQEQEGG